MERYFHSRACEMQANIVKSSLEDLGRDVWRGIERLPDGSVVAETVQGTILHLKWNVDHQCVQVLDRNPIVIELAA